MEVYSSYLFHRRVDSYLKLTVQDLNDPLLVRWANQLPVAASLRTGKPGNEVVDLLIAEYIARDAISLYFKPL